jgi:diguanylate cyclase (GGDEF)-like protein/PAS domain S-box-containing protein
MLSGFQPDHLLAALLATTDDGVLSFSLDGNVQTWSKGAERLYGYLESEMIGQPVAQLIPLYEVPAHDRLLSNPVGPNSPSVLSTERLTKDGARIRLAIRQSPIRNEMGEVVGILERAQPLCWHDGGSAGETQLRLLARQMPLILWTTDRNLRITSNWGAGLRASNVRPGEFIGRPIYDYLKCKDPHTKPVVEHYEALKGISSHFEYQRGDRVLQLDIAPLREASGEIIGCIGSGIDVTARKKSEEQIRYQATHDALTGLANYRDFVDTLEREVRRADRSHKGFGVLLMDLDELKRINDRLGHLAGNRALKRLAEVIKQQCRSTDLAARYGGDEFAVLLIDADPGMARQIAERVETGLRKSEEEPRLTVSVGVAVYPDDGRAAHELLESADKHLYRRKSASRSVAAR